MSISLASIFKKEKNIIIGAIHFPPLLGYPDFPGMKVAKNNALKDLQAFSQGGADGIIFENNYDVPHSAQIGPPASACMAALGSKIKEDANIPVGVSVLWNDYKTALSLARVLDLKFVRIPVFIDRVKTNYGIMEPAASDAIRFRKKIGAEKVAIFTDIHVKHSTILSKFTIAKSANLAIKAGSDALILTGNWTGQAPDLEELKLVRKTVGSFPILLGSGIDTKNAKSLMEYANGAIVSTSLKDGGASHEVNIKKYKHRINRNKVKALTRIL